MTHECVSCTPDALEPNNSFMEAVVADRAAGAQLNTCGGADFYAVEVGAGKTLNARVSFVHDSGDIDVRLYDRDGTTQLASSAGTDDNEEISHMVMEAGVYFINVYGFLGANNTYTLSVTQQ